MTFSEQISICICTRNRPDDLRQALDSLQRSTYPIYQVIVSDDSTNDASERLVKTHYPNVQYLTGPRKGLGANRNHALTAVQGSHVVFIDDDVIFAPDFLTIALIALHQQASQSDRDPSTLILTGLENRRGELVPPHEQNFLGFQNVEYQPHDRLKTVVINSAIFPKSLFEHIQFDSKLIYGNDEVDLSTRAVQIGYQIMLCPSAVNFHYPSMINRDYYQPYQEATRIYVTFKRYLSTEKNLLKATLFFIVAIVHTAAHAVKTDGVKALSQTFATLQKTLSYILAEYLPKQQQIVT